MTRAHHHLPGLSPGDLAGSQRAQHTLDERTPLPEACGALVGKNGLTVWLAFDPEGSTDFAMRPAQSTDASEDERGYASRLPASEVPEHVAVQPDPGLDIELESVSLAGSVLEVRADDPVGGDFTADTLLSVDGAMTPQQTASITNATVSYTATIHPLGDARPGCVAAGTAAPETLEIVSLDGAGHPAYATTSTVKLHGAHVESSHALPLHYPAALRSKIVTGDWACWDDFAVDVCFTTLVQQNSAPDEGTADEKLGAPKDRRLTWAFEPGIRADLKLEALGGTVEGFNRLRFGSKAESRYEIFAWDPIELASWNLVDKSHVLSGARTY